ncbi:MAG: hypothetical protein AAFP97_00910 [Pseudomonadota bacterium]
MLAPVRLLACALGLMLLSASRPALAQSTGSVASPVIKPGATFGLAGAVGWEDGETNFAHRLDYRQTVGETTRLSAIAFFNDRGGAYRFRRFAVEAMHQFASDREGWSSAAQARLIVPDGNDGVTGLRLAWINRWKPAVGGELRLIGLATREFGADRESGLALETRGEATWAIGADTRVGLQTYNRYNNTTNFGAFRTQRHSVGGVLKGSLTDTVSYRINAVTGMSEPATDFELRFRLNVKL